MLGIPRPEFAHQVRNAHAQDSLHEAARVARGFYHLLGVRGHRQRERRHGNLARRPDAIRAHAGRFFGVRNQMSACKGKDDVWRRTQGCTDPRTSARIAAGDLACDATPGIFEAGYCDCADDVPRHFPCGVAKEPCGKVCVRPPPPSSLPSTSDPPSRPFDRSRRRAPTSKFPMVGIVVVLVVLVVFVIPRVFAPPNLKAAHERWVATVEEQRRARRFADSLP